jgi:hypothetical protein
MCSREGGARNLRTELDLAFCNQEFFCIRRINDFCRLGEEIQKLLGVDKALVD